MLSERLDSRAGFGKAESTERNILGWEETFLVSVTRTNLANGWSFVRQVIPSLKKQDLNEQPSESLVLPQLGGEMDQWLSYMQSGVLDINK